jgi:antitoxin VapB
VLLLPAEKSWDLVIQAVHAFEPGFELQREQPDVQDRPDWR